MEPKFRFFEIVRVAVQHSGRAPYDGLEGAVLGMSRDVNGTWGYAVHIYQFDHTVDLTESELESTGRMAREEDFYDGTVIKVLVDPDTLEGRLADSE